MWLNEWDGMRIGMMIVWRYEKTRQERMKTVVEWMIFKGSDVECTTRQSQYSTCQERNTTDVNVERMGRKEWWMIDKGESNTLWMEWNGMEWEVCLKWRKTIRMLFLFWNDKWKQQQQHDLGCSVEKWGKGRRKKWNDVFLGVSKEIQFGNEGMKGKE